MNRYIAFCAIVVMLILSLNGCSGNDRQVAGGEVIMATDSVVETGAFRKSNGEMCQMKVTLVVSYPQSYKDSATVKELQQLFGATMLNAPKGTSSIKEAMKRYAQALVSQDSQPASGDSLSMDADEIDIDRYEPHIAIKVVYDDNDVLTFCREETIAKNGQNTSMSHHYVSFDLQNMKRITLSDMFRDDSYDKITALLKAKLIDDKGVSNEDELNDLGYFNLPNLSVTGNFFFTSRGVTWSYDSSVIAVASVGEPTINIDYSDLEPYYSDNSILKRM